MLATRVPAAPPPGIHGAFRDRLDSTRKADTAAAAAPALPIPIRFVPRAALAALVARLQAQGFHHVG